MNSENMEMSEYVWYSCLELVIRGIWSSCMFYGQLINVSQGYLLSRSLAYKNPYQQRLSSSDKVNKVK